MTEEDSNTPQWAELQWLAHARLTRDKISVDIPETTIADFLRKVSAVFEIHAVIPEELERDTISLKLANQDWQSLFDTALLPCGYDWYVEDGRVWIVDLEESEKPLYTDFIARLLFAKVTEVEAVLRLFLNRDDKESLEIFPKWNQARFHVRKDRLSALKVFVQNVDEEKNTQPGATDNPDDAQRLREDH